MPTYHVSLSFTQEQLDTADGALQALERQLQDLVSLGVSERRELYKMGEKSEVFTRETLAVLGQNPKLVPESLNLPKAQGNLVTLDALRPLVRRLKQLTARAESTETALGADALGAALEGYNLLKISGKHHGLEGKRRELGNRFGRRRTPKVPEPA